MRNSLALAGLLAGTAVATPALAQIAPSSSTNTSTVPPTNDTQSSGVDPSVAARAEDDIVVTARRVLERSQDIPLAISAVSGLQLQNQSVRDLRDLGAIVPNLAVQSGNTDPNSVVFAIRGQSQSNVLLTVDSAVGIYVDNVSNPRSYGLRSGLVDIERVEVLRGPQGTLYGRNTTGGAVSIVTQAPRAELSASVQATLGNYDARSVLAVVNVPVTDGLATRFVAQFSSHDGYYKSLVPAGQFRNTPLSDETTYLRGRIRGETGGLTVDLSADHFHTRSGGYAPKLVGLINGTIANVPGAVSPTAANPDGRGPLVLLGGRFAQEIQIELGLPFTADGLRQASGIAQSYIDRRPNFTTFETTDIGFLNKGNSVALNAEMKLGDAVTARSISGYRNFFREGTLAGDGTPFLGHFSPNRTNYDFYSQELQLLGGDKHLNWVLGGYYSKEDGAEFGTSSTAQRVAATVTTFDGVTSSKSYAVYGQANWNFAPGLTLTVGGRYTKETKGLVNRNRSTTGCQIPVSLRDNGVDCVASLKNSYSDPSWLVSLDYKIKPDILVYGKVSRGFRGGGQNYRAIGIASTAPFTPFSPETVTEYEVGLKSEFLDRRVRLNLAAFYDQYDDAQRSVTLFIAGQTATVVTNAAQAKLKGFEAETTIRVSDAITLDAALGHFSPKYVTFSDFTGDRSNEPWPASSDNFRIGGRFVQPTSFGDLALRVDYTYTGKVTHQPFALARQQLLQPAYGLLNARLALNIDSWDAAIAVFGRNLTQQHYFVAGSSLEGIGINTMQGGDPRTVGLQITKRFGGGS